MTIYAIRHLKTPWNVEQRLQGEKDISVDPLLPENLRLIEGLKKSLNDINVERTLVSPMKRTIETAELLELENWQIEPNVKEAGFGEYEGMKKAEAIEQIGDSWFENVFDSPLKDQFEILEDRVKHFLESYSDSDSILLISHGMFIKALRAWLLQGSIAQLNKVDIKNGEVHTFEYAKT